MTWQKIFFKGIDYPSYFDRKFGPDFLNGRQPAQKVYETAEACVKSEGHRLLFFRHPWYVYALMLIGSLVLYPVSWLYYLLTGLMYLWQKNFKYQIVEKIAVYKKDPQGKCGRLLKHDKIVKTYEIPSDEALSRSLNRRKALLYFLVLAVLYGLPLMLLQLR